MILVRSIRWPSAAPLAMLCFLLGLGLPIRPESDHDGSDAHIEADHGGHWVVLLRHEMQPETTQPLVFFIVPARPSSVEEVQRVKFAPGTSTHDIGFASRAPPSVIPRAPPPLT